MGKFLLLALLGFVLVGCSGDGGGATAESANEKAAMEKQANEKALKDNPPPPGEGPGN